MPDYLVGSDVGTGGTKSVAIDTEGNTLGKHFIEYPLITNSTGGLTDIFKLKPFPYLCQ